jgi:hypothetical protein
MDLSSVGRSFLTKLFGDETAKQVPEEEATMLGYQIESQKIKDELARFKRANSALANFSGKGGI